MFSQHNRLGLAVITLLGIWSAASRWLGLQAGTKQQFIHMLLGSF